MGHIDNSTMLDVYTKGLRTIVTNPMLMERACEVTSNIKIIDAVCHNADIFASYYHDVSKKYDTLAEALLDLQGDSVLIYFADIMLYGLFSPAEYAAYCDTISTEPCKVISEQLSGRIMLIDGRQKLIFISNEARTRSKIMSYVEQCLTPEITQQIIDADNEIIEAYRCVYNHAKQMNDSPWIRMTQSVLAVERFRLAHECTQDHSVMAIRIVGAVPFDMQNMPQLAAQPAPQPAPAPHIVAKGGGARVEYHEAPQADPKVTHAGNWIDSNSPDTKDTPRSYYDRYTKSTVLRLSVPAFNGVMRQKGYTTLTVNKTTYWRWG
jgi:hypothetical protein